MGRRKDVWESSVTVHLTMKERTNRVLFELAKADEATKSKVLEKLLHESPSFVRMLERLREQGAL